MSLRMLERFGFLLRKWQKHLAKRPMTTCDGELIEVVTDRYNWQLQCDDFDYDYITLEQWLEDNAGIERDRVLTVIVNRQVAYKNAA